MKRCRLASSPSSTRLLQTRRPSSDLKSTSLIQRKISNRQATHAIDRHGGATRRPPLAKLPDLTAERWLLTHQVMSHRTRLCACRANKIATTATSKTRRHRAHSISAHWHHWVRLTSLESRWESLSWLSAAAVRQTVWTWMEARRIAISIKRGLARRKRVRALSMEQARWLQLTTCSLATSSSKLSRRQIKKRKERSKRHWRWRRRLSDTTWTRLSLKLRLRQSKLYKSCSKIANRQLNSQIWLSCANMSVNGRPSSLLTKKWWQRKRV